jgi:hypothetical protein
MANRASPGAPFQPSARWYNDVSDMLSQWKRAKGERGGISSARANGDVVRIKNASGVNLPQFAIVGLDDLYDTELDDETNQLDQFKSSPVCVGVEPAFPEHVGRYVVLLQPLKNNTVGDALTGGCVPVKLQAVWNRDKYAEIYEVGDALDDTTGRNDKYRLVSRDFGSAEILWREPDGESDTDGTPRDKWAFVRVGKLVAVKRRFELKAGLARGSSATAYIRRWNPAGGGTWETTEEEFTVHGSDMRALYGEGPSTEDGLLGERGKAEYHYESGKFYAEQMQCSGDRDAAPEE